MIASPQPNPHDGSWGISDEWGRFRQISLVESQPRWSDWHWNADSRLVRVNLDNIDEEEDCGDSEALLQADRAVLEQDLQTLRDIRQEYLDLALKAKSKSRESELMLGVRDKDRQIAWVEGKLRELGADCDQSGGDSQRDPFGNHHLSSSKMRRHKGDGSGCIYWRTVTRNGKDYQQAYYHWREQGRQRTRYIPKELLDQVLKAESQKLPVAEILVLLGGDEKCSSKSSDTSQKDEKSSARDKCSSKISPPSTKRRKQGYGAGYIECKPIKRSGKEYPQYWYHYEIWDKGDCLQKNSRYIPKRLQTRVGKLEAEKAPVSEILKLLGVKK
jgi:hypothetical protein